MEHGFPPGTDLATVRTETVIVHVVMLLLVLSSIGGLFLTRRKPATNATICGWGLVVIAAPVGAMLVRSTLIFSRQNHCRAISHWVRALRLAHKLHWNNPQPYFRKKTRRVVTDWLRCFEPANAWYLDNGHASSCPDRERGSAAQPMQEQPEATRPWLAQLPGYTRRIPKCNRRSPRRQLACPTSAILRSGKTLRDVRPKLDLDFRAESADCRSPGFHTWLPIETCPSCRSKGPMLL